MKSFKRGEKGFTLIELLIVVAILGVLAAVVIPNVVGLMGRGGKQAYQTDKEVIQLASATFFSDVHGGFISGLTPAASLWGCNVTATADDPGHYYPTALGTVGAHTLVLNTDPLLNDPAQVNNPRLDSIQGTAADNPAILAHAIWMGLLVNAPGDGVDPDGVATRGNVSALITDTGLYLQNMPKSAMTGNERNGSDPPGGGYCWVVGKNGTVYGAYLVNTTWYAGFGGAYP